MIKNRITEGMANMLLRQLGAVEIKNSPAFINKVKFKLDDETNVTYIYEVKEGEPIYLNRVRPYALYLGECADEQELVEKISDDLKIMKAAYESPHFEQVVRILTGIQDMAKEVENLFVSKVTPEVSLDRLESTLSEMYARIKAMRQNADIDLEVYAEGMREGIGDHDAMEKAKEAAAKESADARKK